MLIVMMLFVIMLIAMISFELQKVQRVKRNFIAVLPPSDCANTHYNINCFLGANVNFINPLECLFGIEGHTVLDINPGPGYDTLLLCFIQ